MASKRSKVTLERTYRVKADLITTGPWLKGAELTEDDIAAHDSVDRLLEMDAIEIVDTPVSADAEGGE